MGTAAGVDTAAGVGSIESEAYADAPASNCASIPVGGLGDALDPKASDARSGSRPVSRILGRMPVDPKETRASAWVVTVDTVFPNQTNPIGTLFGGRVLELMDVNASIACARFCRQAVVTASTEPVDFRNPIYVGEIIEVKSRVAWSGRTSMIVRSEVHGENPLTGERRLCTVGHFNFVAIGEDGRPTPVPSLLVADEMERRHWETGRLVREDLQKRRAKRQLEATDAVTATSDSSGEFPA
jgi:acyl-CoA hydrolase